MRCIKCNKKIGVSKIIKLPCDDLPSEVLIITTCITCKRILKKTEELKGEILNMKYEIFRNNQLIYELFSKSI